MTRAFRGGAVLVFLLLLAGCPRGEAPSLTFDRPPAAVTATAVVRSDVPIYLDEIGKCVAREVVSIQPQATGKLVGIHFQDGAEVAKGDRLFTIDPRPYEAQVSLSVANLAQSKAQLELAKIELARAEELLRTRAGAAQDRDAKKGALEVASAKVQSDEAALEIARVNLEYCEIRSPIEGRTGQRLVDLGNVVAANSGASLLVIERLDPIYADFTIAERSLPAVRASMAQGTLRVEVRLAEDDANVRAGELTFLDNSVQEGTGTVKLRATVPNQSRFLWPGQLVRVRLVLGTKKDALLVPVRASQISQKGPYVFLVTKENKAELRPVEPGQRHGDQIAI